MLTLKHMYLKAKVMGIPNEKDELEKCFLLSLSFNLIYFFLFLALLLPLILLYT